MSKKHLTVTISALIVILIAMGWIYPFSFASFNKSFSYNADTAVVDNYTSKLDAFTDLHNEEQIQQDVTTSYMDEVLELLSDPHFTSSQKVNIDANDLEQLQDSIKTFRLKLTHLDRSYANNYNENAQQYLYFLIDNSEYMEHELDNMLDATFSTKRDLRSGFHEVHTNMVTMVEHLTSFYKAYRNTDM